MKFSLSAVVLAACATSAPQVNHSEEQRLARLEHRVNQIVEMLDKALPPAEPDPEARYAVPINANDPQEGPRDAKVTIVEGFEFLCPYCFVVNPTIDRILAKYPRDVRVVGKYLVIHGAPAIPPAMAACAAAKQGKYKEMKAAIWSHLWGSPGDRPSLDKEEASTESLQKTAASVGLNATKLAADMRGRACTEWIREGEEVLRAFNAASTPAFFINGRFVAGAQSFEAFDRVVQEELAAADKAPAADYYEREVMGKGLKKVKGHFDD